MTYYSRPIEMPKTRLDGLRNFVQMIVNQIEGGDHTNALMTAVDLLDTLTGSANPFASITSDKDNRMIEELKRQHAKEMGDALARAEQDGVKRGIAAEKARMARVLELVA